MVVDVSKMRRQAVAFYSKALSLSHRDDVDIAHASAVAQGNAASAMDAFSERGRFSGSRPLEVSMSIKTIFAAIDLSKISRKDENNGDHPRGFSPREYG
jgi:hypothetical protein